MSTNVDASTSCQPGLHAKLPQAVDVLVVGLGALGATIANLLARYGVHVMAIDKAIDSPTMHGAIALNNDALRILQMIGITERDFDATAMPHVRMRRPAFGKFSMVNNLHGHPKFVSVHQHDLEHCLRQQLERDDCADMVVGATLTDFASKQDCIIATLDLGHGRRYSVETRYLISADGAHSLVRKLIEQNSKARIFAQDGNHEDMESTASRRVFLAGDAAYTAPPWLDQDLATGLHDAANLCWKLAWVIYDHADAQILDTYDEERRPHMNAMMGFGNFIRKCVTPRHRGPGLIMHGLLRLLRCVSPWPTYLQELGINPRNIFRRGLFVKQNKGEKLAHGSPLPQTRVRGSDGTTRLSDDVLGRGFALIGFGVDVSSFLDASIAAAFAAAGGSIVQIIHRGQRLHVEAHGAWEDLDSAFLPRLVSVGWAAVIRPDKIIIHDGPATDANRLIRESLTLLGLPINFLKFSLWG
ncbi:FAD-dependent monooxygenase [Dyella acidisoli]|uniref:FAD-binding domain-containing protein n=1 Tax=Dyella acidisoli TaxID=1867834 RepID=A0ABQ5XIQ1_9GAMM|nr:FAD-dependent monooxygenase [Dyella acidisoli]GLQ91492.1 hypothetical protein GCM10007901_04420 [Dyella acidisoli]